MADRFSMTMPGKPHYISAIKLAVGSLAAHEGFGWQEIEDIRFAVGEVCKAITCHSHSFWSSCYEVTAVTDEESLTIIVADQTDDVGIPKECHQCMDCPREGDLSLDIAASLMDTYDVRLENGLMVITMMKKRVQ